MPTGKPPGRRKKEVQADASQSEEAGETTVAPTADGAAAVGDSGKEQSPSLPTEADGEPATTPPAAAQVVVKAEETRPADETQIEMTEEVVDATPTAKALTDTAIRPDAAGSAVEEQGIEKSGKTGRDGAAAMIIANGQTPGAGAAAEIGREEEALRSDDALPIPAEATVAEGDVPDKNIVVESTPIKKNSLAAAASSSMDEAMSVSEEDGDEAGEKPPQTTTGRRGSHAAAAAAAAAAALTPARTLLGSSARVAALAAAAAEAAAAAKAAAKVRAAEKATAATAARAARSRAAQRLKLEASGATPGSAVAGGREGLDGAGGGVDGAEEIVAAGGGEGTGAPPADGEEDDDEDFDEVAWRMKSGTDAAVLTAVRIRLEKWRAENSKKVERVSMIGSSFDPFLFVSVGRRGRHVVFVVRGIIVQISYGMV